MGLYHDQATILIQLFHSNQPLGGDLLCQKIGIGLRTLKKEIDLINDICMQNGCSIRSKMGEGYFLEVSDPAAFEMFRDDVKKNILTICISAMPSPSVCI